MIDQLTVAWLRLVRFLGVMNNELSLGIAVSLLFLSSVLARLRQRKR